VQPPPWLKGENITPLVGEAIGKSSPSEAINNPQASNQSVPPPPHYYNPAYHPYGGGRPFIQDIKEGFNEFYERSIFEFGFIPRLVGNLVRRVIHRIKYGKQQINTFTHPHQMPQYIPPENGQVAAEDQSPGN
jgi:hypothetical protein